MQTSNWLSRITTIAMAISVYTVLSMGVEAQTEIGSLDPPKLSSPVLSTEGNRNEDNQVEAKIDNKVSDIKLPNLKAQNHDDHEEGHKPHGAELLGILPGKTTADDLNKNPMWKTAGHREVVDDFLILTYRIEELPEMPFIQVFLRKEIVQGIVVHLKEPRELKDARDSFKEMTHNVRTLSIPDQDGAFREIYPEKGLAFVLDKNAENSAVPSDRVTQIVVETVNPDYFIIRAEKEFHSCMTHADSDARHALLHDSKNAAAHWFLARLELARGNDKKARESALKAVKLDHAQVSYQLTLIQILIHLGQANHAQSMLKITEPLCKNVPWFECDAMILAGDLARISNVPDYEKAIELHQKAIDFVKPYMNHEKAEVRLQAKRLAHRAHLAMALDIAVKAGNNLQESQTAFKWLNAAGIIADNLVKKENQDVTALWEVCLGAMAVGIHCPESTEIDPYIQTLKRLSSLLIKEKSKPIPLSDKGDTFALSMVEYKTALAFYQAQLVYETRSDYVNAAACGNRAMELLEQVKPIWADSDPVLLGKIVFHLGNVVLKETGNVADVIKQFNHAKAIFEPCLENITPSEMVEVGKILVNMSHVYWKEGQKEEAVDLTLKGSQLLESAHREDVCKKSDLYIPYTNLATMYKNLGKNDLAQKYTELANDAK